MGPTRGELTPELLEKNPQEYSDIKAWCDRTSSNDVWANKIFKPVGILLTGHQANRPYMKKCIETHAQLGLWITLAYDNFVDPEFPAEEFNYDRFMPGKDVMENVDMFIMPHHQVWGGVLYPYFWLLKFGAAAMQGFEWVYCTNSDFIIEKPEGFWELFEMAKGYDVMTCGHDEPGKYANTAGFFIKTKALLDVVKHMQDRFIPFEAYEKWTNIVGNAEGRFGCAIADLNLRQLIVSPPADDMLKVPGQGLWYEKMGFRHIHSEHNHAYRAKKIPPHYSYFDGRFMGDEYNVIKAYWESGDISLLENWWAKE